VLGIHREVLLRYALLHLHNEAAAEDAVQETLLAALQPNGGFRNRPCKNSQKMKWSAFKRNSA
jgi:DNA-directed RNA polymerase specialized sigma24 family protein